MFGPAVIVHGLAHARLALHLRQPVCLISARGAGRYAGAGWWRAMIRAALADHAMAMDVCDILDCDDAPGAAMAALREGQRRLILDPDCPAFAAVGAAAEAMGATILGHRPRSLDLADPRAAAALDQWLVRPASDIANAVE